MRLYQNVTPVPGWSNCSGTSVAPAHQPGVLSMVDSNPDASSLHEPEIALAYGNSVCYSSVPAALQRFKRNSEAERGVDEDQEIPDNLASLLLTNTTLRPLRK
jgi:hypothetical protein